MFRRQPETAATLSILVDGKPIPARAGESVAAALLAAGLSAFRRSPVSGVPRGPYCLMGACYDCLVTIDGQPGRQACQVPVASGMRIETKP
ncbi:MAG: (2Fe-2S)-binding protein [Alphaproteobacteria bacterium]|nr:(2Fe-2S)-binding protein [Alphaproteobacteria bacterium]